MLSDTWQIHRTNDQYNCVFIGLHNKPFNFENHIQDLSCFISNDFRKNALLNLNILFISLFGQHNNEIELTA